MAAKLAHAAWVAFLVLCAGVAQASPEAPEYQPSPTPTQAQGATSPTSGGDIVLLAGSLRFDPQVPKAGETTAISAQVQNVGNRTIQVAASVGIGESHGPGFESIALPRFALGPGQSRTIAHAWPARDGGDYDVRVRAGDAEAPFRVSQLEKRLTVAGGALAHATESGGVALVPGSISFSSTRPQPGEPVVLYARVENVGSRAVRATAEMRVGPDGGVTEGVELGPFTLDPGQGRIISHEWTAGPAGAYAVVVRAGPEGSNAFGMARLDGTLAVGGPSDASGGPRLLLTSGLTNVGNVERGDERTVPVEVTAYNAPFREVRLLVLEGDGLGVEVLTPPTDVPAGQTVKFFVRLAAPAQENATAAESRRILLQAASAEGASNVESINVVLHERGFLGIAWLGAPATLAAVGAGAALAGTFRRK